MFRPFSIFKIVIKINYGAPSCIVVKNGYVCILKTNRIVLTTLFYEFVTLFR